MENIGMVRLRVGNGSETKNVRTVVYFDMIVQVICDGDARIAAGSKGAIFVRIKTRNREVNVHVWIECRG
uniref:Uncharacterized protein n=1 Tax=Rhizophora mucronata TaxID=61149 RepID=A0A2P2P8S9_RHIMU